MLHKDYVISTDDGRKLQVREAGQADGAPVLVHHGTPGSRFLYHSWIDDALSRGIRLISYDRPGYGGSTPYPGRTVASAAEDAAAIASHLKIDRLLTWGASGGGPHALAIAALLPDLVAGAAVIASIAPYSAADLDWFQGMGDIEEIDAALKDRDTLETFIEAHAPGILNANAEGLINALSSQLSPADAAVLTEDYGEFKINQIHVGIKESRDGWIDDDIALITPWGFDLDRIQAPVLLMHGQQDRFVSYSHGEWLAKNIKGVDTQLSADDGHLTLTAAGIPKVHAWLLDQLN